MLPPGRPLFAAAVRALPVGLLLLAWRHRLPRGEWWWKAVVLGLCNIAAFFPLIFLAAYHLPGGLAATLQATSPLAVMAIAWAVIGEKAGLVRIGAALVGLVGVSLLVLRSPGSVDTLGLVGAFGSVLVSGLGFVLIKRWEAPVDMLTLVSWQLVVGGVVLVPVALLVEGAPPALDLPAVLGFVWIAGIGTGLAYVCWFRGLHADVRGCRLADRAGQPGGRDAPRDRLRARGVRSHPGGRDGARAGRRAPRDSVAAPRGSSYPGARASAARPEKIAA